MKTTEIVVTRTIPATAQEIFDLWIDPKSPGGPWYGAKQVILNPVVDGLFYHAVDYEGRTWPHYGRFMRLERPNLLEHTWVSEATKGLESIVSLSLEPDGDVTHVIIRHSGVPDDELGRQHEQGWTWMLDQLADRFAQPSTTR